MCCCHSVWERISSLRFPRNHHGHLQLLALRAVRCLSGNGCSHSVSVSSKQNAPPAHHNPHTDCRDVHRLVRVHFSWISSLKLSNTRTSNIVSHLQGTCGSTFVEEYSARNARTPIAVWHLLKARKWGSMGVPAHRFFKSLVVALHVSGQKLI